MQTIKNLTEEFSACRGILLALGDENRQHLILEMMQMEERDGVRVGQITEKTNLSRPAVSHHLQILKNAGIIKMRREGTKNYYYINPNGQELDRLLNLFSHAKEVVQNMHGKNQQAEF